MSTYLGPLLYYQPAELFYHRQIGERLQKLGFRVILVRRLWTHPVWIVRMKADDHPHVFLKPFGLLTPTVLRQFKSVLRQLATRASATGFVLTGRGDYHQVVFIWPSGHGGVWLPQATGYLQNHSPVRESELEDVGFDGRN